MLFIGSPLGKGQVYVKLLNAISTGRAMTASVQRDDRGHRLQRRRLARVIATDVRCRLGRRASSGRASPGSGLQEGARPTPWSREQRTSQ